MFKVGDLIKVAFPHDISGKYINKVFAIIRIDGNVYFCIRGNMTYHKIFYRDEIENVESKPKFSIGASVIISDSLIGIVEASNHLGSMIRCFYGGEHYVKYISNRKVKVMK